MKLIFRLLLLSAFVILFTTCKKYPDGGWSNVAIQHLFGSNTNQASKKWKLKLYEVNGIDSTSYIAPGNGVTNFQNDEVTFSISIARGHDYSLSSKVYGYGVGFSNDKKAIRFTGGSRNGTQCDSTVCERRTFIPMVNVTNRGYWKILKLTNNQFIITGEFVNHYKIILTN